MSTAAPRPTRLAGDVVLRSPVSVTAATAGLCALLAALLLLAALIQVPSERTLSGVLEADGAGVRAVLAAPPADAARLRPGQTVALTLPAALGAQPVVLTGTVAPSPDAQIVVRIDDAEVLPQPGPVAARVTLGRTSLLSLVAGSVYRGRGA